MAGAVDFDAEYRIFDGKTRLNGEELTRRFLSLHLRTVALEEKGASWDALQTEGLSEALRRINAVITPLIVETQGEITDLNGQIAAGLALLEAKVAEAEARLDTIIAGGLPAADVAESVSRVFVSAAQRSALDAAKAAVDAILKDATADLNSFAEVATALSGKLSTSAKASAEQAKAGTDDTTYITPARAADAIGALAKAARYDNVVVLAASQTWTAPTKLKARVTVVGGCGSGAVIRRTGGYYLCGATGGAAGGVSIKTLASVEAAAQFTATVGAGGAAGTTDAGNTDGVVVNGTAGGSSSFVGPGVNMAANGGQGGTGQTGANTTVPGAVGGTATGGDLNIKGGNSGSATTSGGAAGAGTGGGACGLFGIGYPSGDAVASSVNNILALTGGASVGGASGNATATTSPACSGGAGAGGPSPSVTNTMGQGGPNLAGRSPSGPSIDAPAFSSLRALTATASGFAANFTPGNFTGPVGPGGAWGASVSFQSHGNSGDFAASPAVSYTGSTIYAGSPGRAAGSGAVILLSAGTAYGAPGSAGFIIIEWTAIP